MISANPTFLLAGLFVALSATSAVASDSSPAMTGVVSTGGPLTLLGFALLGAGAVLLIRARGEHAAQDTSVGTAAAETAATAESPDVQRLLRLASETDRPRAAGTAHYVENGGEETVYYRGGVLKTSPAREAGGSELGPMEPSLEKDNVARQMLEALRAERARRHA